jgi:hypothetical protein
MKAKLRSYYVFSLYGAMRGVEGAFIGSVIFTIFWILAPLLVLGLSHEMTQYVFSRMLIILIPASIFLGLIASLVPGVVGGILLSSLLHNDLLEDAKRQVVILKGFIVGISTGFLMWWILWKLDPLNPPLSIERNLFVYYSITGILSTAVGGVRAAVKLAKDSN